MSYFIGIDLGQAAEPTGIVVVESNTLPHEMREFRTRSSWTMKPVFTLPDGTETLEHPPVSYLVRHIDRLIGVSYPQVLERMQVLAASLSPKAIVVDATGVGKAALELFRRARLEIDAVTITGGDAISHESYREYRIPKRELVTTAQVLLQTDRLKIARSLQHGELLGKELRSFKVRIDPATSQDSYLAWREGQNDDLVLALCVVLWMAEKNNGGVPQSSFTLIARPERGLQYLV